jgi:hypothetical protein
VRFADLRGAPAAGQFPPGSMYGGMISWPAITPQDYIKGFVIPRQRGLDNVRIVEQKELPEVAAGYAKEVDILNRAAGQFGVGNVAHRSGLVSVEYDRGGTRYRETFFSVLMYIQTPGITLWWSRVSASSWAPADKFDAWQPYTVVSLSSLRFNNYWVVRYIRLTNEAYRRIHELDKVIRKIDDDITANRCETNFQIMRDMYPLLAPYADFLGPDGKTRFLPTGTNHQVDPVTGRVRSGDDLPDADHKWKKLNEYTGQN